MSTSGEQGWFVFNQSEQTRDLHRCRSLIKCIYSHAQSHKSLKIIRSATHHSWAYKLRCPWDAVREEREGNWQRSTACYSHTVLQGESHASQLLQPSAAVNFSVPLFFIYLQNWEKWSLFQSTACSLACTVANAASCSSLMPKPFALDTPMLYTHRGLQFSLVMWSWENVILLGLRCQSWLPINHFTLQQNEKLINSQRFHNHILNSQLNSIFTANVQPSRERTDVNISGIQFWGHKTGSIGLKGSLSKQTGQYFFPERRLKKIKGYGWSWINMNCSVR